jgi:predicted nucleic acid-binding protein
MADLVIDASLASAWCFPDERTVYANGVLRAVSSSVEAFAPRLWAYEVRNSVLMGLRRGRISKADAEGFLASLADLNIHLADPVSYDAVFKLAESSGLTVYDAAYGRTLPSTSTSPALSGEPAPFARRTAGISA